MEKHMTITVVFTQIIKSNLHLIHPQTYYITKSGVLQSLRKPQDGTIRIGRESFIDTNFVYNDIMLNTQNPLISRSHCFINYQEFFREGIPDAVLSFLMGSHTRLGQKSVLLSLPQTLFKYILDFILEPRLPIIISPSSVTYKKVTEAALIRHGMEIFVGFEFYLTVEALDDFVCVIKSDNFGWCFSFTYSEDKEFCVGKELMDELGIRSDGVEQVLFRVKCCRNRWWIVDGDCGKPSRNGTWVRLGDSHEFVMNGTEVRIGEFILKIEW